MKSLKVILIFAFAASALACNKKTEKCTYNGVDMPCDEYRRMTSPKPSPTPEDGAQTQEVQTADDLEASVASAKVNNPECAAKAEKLYESGQVIALCNSTNPDTQKCIENAHELGFKEKAVLKICKDSPEEEA